MSLNHVNLNPFSWHVYVSNSNGNPVTISNSKVNEAGALTNGIVNIATSTLQLAFAGAYAPGAQLNISGSDIWSQAIQAQNGGHVALTNGYIHGNYISAAGTGSNISLTTITDDRNGTAGMSCTPGADGNPPNNNGVPLCNPYNPIGQCSQIVMSGGGAVTGSAPCP